MISRLVGAIAAVALLPAMPASAQTSGMCRVVEVHFTPSDDLQIVVWLEDSEGGYVDTAFITRATGSYGLGNRPGMVEFNTAYRWPYGRRVTTFPVWAHRHGKSFPLVVFQNWEENDPLVYTVEDPTPLTSPEENLSHPLSQSSRELYYCRPFLEGDPGWDAQSCASATGVFTDKGMFHPSLTSAYPMRSDLLFEEGIDSEDALQFTSLNVFDSVSRATPVGGAPFAVSWPIPTQLPNGDYVAWVEVSKEIDVNEFYDERPYGAGELMWGQYGVPYLGQPSVVYSVPLSISADPLATTSTMDWVGYGDPDGLDGQVRAPDGTINTDVPGSGASRLQLTTEDSMMFRVKVVTINEEDDVPPGNVEGLTVVDESPRSVSLTFAATGDDGDEGFAASYDVRYLAGEPVTEANFDRAEPVSASIEPTAAGLQIDINVTGLMPSTHYYFAVRAQDNCFNTGPLATAVATTPPLEGGRVDACFIATAAYGSAMAAEVSQLRRFRDLYLETNVPGQLAVLAYYTLSPPLASTIAPSPTLREAVRGLLRPWVAWAATFPAVR